ncbi:MAG: Glyoxylase, beta-lactamase superfamily, partial [Verrucomicrobiales bacterium]|nr:Glyoxylase, beta-lactamase superfamily [Verrucomicrobiales bacterium]
RELAWLASNFRAVVPSGGRYVREPAIADERGVMYIPPPVQDRLPAAIGAVAVAFCAGMIWGKFRRKSKRV